MTTKAKKVSILRGPAQLADLPGALCVSAQYPYIMVSSAGPADALLSPEPGGDQSTLFARNVVQGYARACLSFYFGCVVFVLLRCFR